MSEKEVNHTKKINKCDIHILDYISINIDEDDTLGDYEYVIIYLDVDLPNMLSIQLHLHLIWIIVTLRRVLL